MPAFIRSHPVRDLTRRRLWNTLFPYCMACGHPGNEWGRHLETHHLAKPGRSDEEVNLLRLCQRCHTLAEGLTVRENGVALPKLTPGICLTLKSLLDPLNFDQTRLAQLLHAALPELEPVPDYFVREFQRRRGLCLK